VRTRLSGGKSGSVVPFYRHVGTYVLASLLPALVFLPNIGGFFVADDWPVIARNVNLWQDGMRVFTSTRFGWYRPLFDGLIFLCWRLFGLNPTGYHVCALVLYVLVSSAVGALGELLTHERAIGFLSTFLFAIHGSHAEPVLWIASANELLAGLFVVLSMAGYVLFRRSGKWLWLLAAWLGYLLGLASKETATFLPVMMIAYDILLYRSPGRKTTWRTYIPAAPFVLTGIIFVILRLWAGSPYPTSVGIWRIAANLGYYSGVLALALPDNYGYFTSLPLWRQDPLIPILTVGLAASSLAILGWLLLTSKAREIRRRSRPLAFAVAWSLLALLPVLLTATGRTAFLASMGVTWTAAILFISVWRESPPRQARRWALVALALFSTAHLTVSAYRVYWWRQASETSEAVMDQVQREFLEEGINSSLWLVNLPDHLKHAYTFRNAFPAAGELLFPGSDIRAVLDIDLITATRQQAMDQISCTDCAIFWYETGALERLQ
jgi:hypothetical protein